jgi:hypothetical protein
MIEKLHRPIRVGKNVIMRGEWVEKQRDGQNVSSVEEKGFALGVGGRGYYHSR